MSLAPNTPLGVVPASIAQARYRSYAVRLHIGDRWGGSPDAALGEVVEDRGVGAPAEVLLGAAGPSGVAEGLEVLLRRPATPVWVSAWQTRVLAAGGGAHEVGAGRATARMTSRVGSAGRAGPGRSRAN